MKHWQTLVWPPSLVKANDFDRFKETAEITTPAGAMRIYRPEIKGSP